MGSMEPIKGPRLLNLNFGARREFSWTPKRIPLAPHSFVVMTSHFTWNLTALWPAALADFWFVVDGP